MTVKYTKQEALAIKIANAIATGGTIQQSINLDIASLRKERKGKELGTIAKGCAVMVRVVEAWQAFVKPDGKKLSEQTIKNYATAFRTAYNNNKPFSMNPYREKASVKKGAKTEPKATTGVKFKGDAKLEDIVKGLRSMFNKFKENDKTASLASYLIDALDDFEGK